MEMKICHLYPDTLGQFGDKGNMTCLAQRLRWRGIEPLIDRLSEAKGAELRAYDLIYIGSGMGVDAALGDIRAGAGERLREAAEAGVTILAVCEGLEILGKYRLSVDGTKHGCAGLADFYVELKAERLVGDCLYKCDCGEVVAFENSAARLRLGPDAYPLGMVQKGHGNNGEDGTAGVRYIKLFGLLCHGPLLPKNPALADTILSAALQRRYPDLELSPLDDGMENSAHEYMVRRLTR